MFASFRSSSLVKMIFSFFLLLHVTYQGIKSQICLVSPELNSILQTLAFLSLMLEASSRALAAHINFWAYPRTFDTHLPHGLTVEQSLPCSSFQDYPPVLAGNKRVRIDTFFLTRAHPSFFSPIGSFTLYYLYISYHTRGLPARSSS